MARVIHENRGLFSRKVFRKNIQLRYKKDEAFKHPFSSIKMPNERTCMTCCICRHVKLYHDYKHNIWVKRETMMELNQNLNLN